MSNKTCPSCGYEGTKRVRNEEDELACPECHIALVNLEGEWITKDAVPPTQNLYEYMVQEMRAYLSTSFYTYEIEDPLIPKKKLKETWKKYYSIIREEYPLVEREDVINAFNFATSALVDKLARQNDLSINLVVYGLDKPFWAKKVEEKLEHVQNQRNQTAVVDDDWLNGEDNG